MEPVAAGGLRRTDEAELVEEGLHPPGAFPDLVERDARGGVEVDAELVGVVGVGRLVRPHVEPEAADVDGPGDVGEVGDDEGVGRRPVGGADDVVWSQSGASFGTRFWKKFVPPAPSGNRCSSTGRPPMVAMTGSRTAS